jgi:bacterioferritin
MAKENVQMLGRRIDVKNVLARLNAALAEEWLAYYQYWVGAQVVEGAMRSDIQREFLEHAAEEFRHADLLAKRIVELDGTPILDPQLWTAHATCKYAPPREFDVMSLLRQNIAAEKCAIFRYQDLADFTAGKDYTTCDLAKQILAEEEEHAQDLGDYERDLQCMIEATQRIEARACSGGCGEDACQ